MRRLSPPRLSKESRQKALKRSQRQQQRQVLVRRGSFLPVSWFFCRELSRCLSFCLNRSDLTRGTCWRLCAGSNRKRHLLAYPVKKEGKWRGRMWMRQAVLLGKTAPEALWRFPPTSGPETPPSERDNYDLWKTKVTGWQSKQQAAKTPCWSPRWNWEGWVVCEQSQSHTVAQF